MDKAILEIPVELLEAAKITPEEAKTELAIRLYQQHKLNEEQARELAGDPKVIEELAWGSRATGRIDLDQFLSWASHDLKSPLNTIIGFTRVVIKGIDGPVNEAQAADLTTAFTSSPSQAFRSFLSTKRMSSTLFAPFFNPLSISSPTIRVLAVETVTMFSTR